MIYKKLIKESEDFIKLVNSYEYQILQNKFDTLYLQIKKELQTLQRIQYELTHNKSKFIRDNNIKIVEIDTSKQIKIQTIDSHINEFDKILHNYQSLNF